MKVEAWFEELMTTVLSTNVKCCHVMSIVARTRAVVAPRRRPLIRRSRPLLWTTRSWCGVLDRTLHTIATIARVCVLLQRDAVHARIFYKRLGLFVSFCRIVGVTAFLWVLASVASPQEPTAAPSATSEEIEPRIVRNIRHLSLLAFVTTLSGCHQRTGYGGEESPSLTMRST